MAGLVHAKCLATSRREQRTLICGKSRDHRSDQHYDPSADERWTDVAEKSPKEQ